MRCSSVELGKTILIGSKTIIPIQVGKVKVEDYTPGFEDAAGNDFATVSFD